MLTDAGPCGATGDYISSRERRSGVNFPQSRVVEMADRDIGMARESSMCQSDLLPIQRFPFAGNQDGNFRHDMGIASIVETHDLGRKEYGTLPTTTTVIVYTCSPEIPVGREAPEFLIDLS